MSLSRLASSLVALSMKHPFARSPLSLLLPLRSQCALASIAIILSVLSDQPSCSPSSRPGAGGRPLAARRRGRRRPQAAPAAHRLSPSRRARRARPPAPPSAASGWRPMDLLLLPATKQRDFSAQRGGAATEGWRRSPGSSSVMTPTSASPTPRQEWLWREVSASSGSRRRVRAQGQVVVGAVAWRRRRRHRALGPARFAVGEKRRRAADDSVFILLRRQSFFFFFFRDFNPDLLHFEGQKGGSPRASSGLHTSARARIQKK